MAKLKVQDLSTIKEVGNALGTATTSAAEFDKLDGLTATTAELNYTDGVTSAIQTQINNITFNNFSKNIVHSSGPDNFSTYSTSFISIPGTSLTITPTNTKSRIMLWYRLAPHLNCQNPAVTRHMQCNVYRNRSGQPEVDTGCCHTERTIMATQTGQYSDKTKMFMHIDHPNTSGAAVVYHMEGKNFESGANSYYHHSYNGTQHIKGLAFEVYTGNGQSYTWQP